MTLPAEAHTVAGSFSKRELTNTADETAYSAPWDLDEQPVASSLVNRSMQSGIKLRQTSAVGDVGVQDTQNALALGSTPHSAQVEPCSNDASSRGKALSTVAKCKQDSIKGDGLLVRDEADTQHKEATGTTGPEKQFAELDSSERASARAFAARGASPTLQMPVVSVNGRDKQDRRVHNAEDMAEDSQVPASPTPAAGGPDTSATMIHPGGVGTAAGFKKRVRAHQRLNGMWEALSNQRFSQLERFLFVLSRADSRLAAIPESTLRSRVCFLSCSSSETMTIDSATRQVWFRQLAPVLQNVDPFETRVLQLEDFVERHGRLPSLDKSLPQEYRLAIFLKNTGYYIRQGGMAAMQRYQ